MLNCLERSPVLTKRDFVRRYENNQFGNRSPTWDTYDEWKQSGYSGSVHIRNRISSGVTYYNIEAEAVSWIWTSKGCWRNPEDWYISAMAPHEHTLLQGEVQQSERGLDLLYTRIKKPMRDALSEQRSQVHGLVAVSMLKYCLCANSWEWLQYLLEAYPGHVIEFSTFSRFWGTMPRYNTVFWEVRLF